MACLRVCVPPPVLRTFRDETMSPSARQLQGSAQGLAYLILRYESPE